MIITAILFSASTGLIILSIAAGIISVQILRHSAGSRVLPGCGSGSGCDAVTRSRWSRLGQIPVATIALALYFLVFVLALLTTPAASLQIQSTASKALAVLAPLVAGSAVWVLFLQVIVVRRVCMYCMLTNGISILMALCIYRSMPVPTQSSISLGDHLTIPRFAPSAIALILLIAGQVLLPPKTYEVTETAPASNSHAFPNHVAHVSSFELPVVEQKVHNPFAGRTITTYGGKVVLPATDWPIIGSPNADHVLLFFFDYTCTTCRHLHRLLMSAIANYGDRVSVMMVPVPADPTCNSKLKRWERGHENGCAYARLGIAIWLKDPHTFTQYDRYLTEEGDRPPPLGKALAFARTLIGPNLDNPEVPDRRFDSYLHRGVELHRSIGEEQTPTLLLPNGRVRGRVPTLNDLLRILQEQIGRPPSSSTMR